MRPLVPVLILFAFLARPLSASESAPLPRGDDRFRLGMTREEVEAGVRRRGLEIVSDEPLFLVSSGAEDGVEYAEYAFFQPPHGDAILWRVTFGYRLESPGPRFAALDSTLRGRLGEPTAASVADDEAKASRQTTWTDGRTRVLLAGRWPVAARAYEEPEPTEAVDRLIVEWSDLRTRHAIERPRPRKK